MSSPSMSFLEGAAHVLRHAGKPLHASDIWRLLDEQHLVRTEGKSPQATLHSVLATHVKQRGAASQFVRVAPGTFALREQAGGNVQAMTVVPPRERVKVPWYPTLTQLRGFLRAIDGMSRQALYDVRAAVEDGAGTVDEVRDWSDPDAWIDERLPVDLRGSAHRIWEVSGRVVNPRWVAGCLLASNRYRLMEENDAGVLHATPRGRSLQSDSGEDVLRDIDDHEGLLFLLALLAERGPSRVAELHAGWLEYLHQQSDVRSENAARTHLRYRLLNLEDRGLVEREAARRVITDAGLAWLGASGFSEERTGNSSLDDLHRLIREHREGVRTTLRETLGDIEPYAFEHVVKSLLDAMGYEDVMVTERSNDKGVDVIARITVGITSIREVVQVKRQQANVHRPVLDQLRGSLHRWQAVRGTIVTLGKFSEGTSQAAFELGAAPITLIDGERLLDLLMEHEIGVRKREVPLWDLDASAFGTSEAPE